MKDEGILSEEFRKFLQSGVPRRFAPQGTYVSGWGCFSVVTAGKMMLLASSG